MLVLRSVLFNAAFYINLFIWMTGLLPLFIGPRRYLMAGVKMWSRSNLPLLKYLAGIKVEFRNLEALPAGAYIVAAKHQSALETVILLSMVEDPAFILKRELMWLPMFGWFLWATRQIPIDRGARAVALAAMMTHAKAALEQRRQILIFPEGTRTAPHAEPAYKFGIAHLYASLNTTVVPLALNSGLFWPRRTFLRHPGTVVIEILPAIPPGLSKTTFLRKLQSEIETATNRLVAAGEVELGRRAP